MIGDELSAALLELREHAESLMRDACTVQRPGDVIDRVTGVAQMTTVYDGRCKVQTYEGYEQNPVAGGHQFTVQRYRVDLPVGAFLPEVGDVVTITAAERDQHLVGKDYRVSAPFNKTLATAYRCFVDEVVA